MGQKQCFLITAIKSLRIPPLPELAIKKMWPQAIRHPDFLRYLPDEWGPEYHKTERDFFFAILTTLCPGFMESLISDCYAQRRSLKLDKETGPNYLQIAPEVAEALLSEDYTSSK
jgi:hypothetical protein